jgi:hypothetical protein
MATDKLTGEAAGALRPAMASPTILVRHQHEEGKMPGIIRWKATPRQEGWIGYLGDVRMWSVILWSSEEHRWPWQLQTHMPDLLQRDAVLAARSSDDAKDIAERSVAWMLTRTQLAPPNQDQLDAVIPYLRNREAEQDHTQWLRETGWWDDNIEPVAS